MMSSSVFRGLIRSAVSLGLVGAGTACAQPITVDSATGAVSGDANINCTNWNSTSVCSTGSSGTSGVFDFLVNPSPSYTAYGSCGFSPSGSQYIEGLAEGSYTVTGSGPETLEFTMWGAGKTCFTTAADCDMDAEAHFSAFMQITCVTDVKVFGHLVAGPAFEGCDSSINFTSGTFILGASGSGQNEELINHVFPAGTVISVVGGANAEGGNVYRQGNFGCWGFCDDPGYSTGFWIDADFDEYCLPDTNKDGMLSSTDFTAWVDAYNNDDLLIADQNGDGQLTPTDFTAFLANTTRGCPW